MLVENLLIRPLGTREVSLSWTSEDADQRSYIFINGMRTVGGFIPGTKERSATLPVPVDGAFRIEVHDMYADEDVPDSTEEPPLIQPLISWNSVSGAVAYKIYHTAAQGEGTIETLLATVPALPLPRIEINCPIKLEGRNGKWHFFRVESVDKFGDESVSEVIPYFASDLPPTPELIITRDTQTRLLSFRIL